MSFLSPANVFHKFSSASGWAHVFDHSGTPGPPQPPNPNDALNAAQATRDQMRQRRGMLANIYAGAANQQPVTGKTQLGT